MNRRQFMQSSVGKSLFLMLGLSESFLGSRFRPLVGVCTDLKNASIVLHAGGDFLEETVGGYLKPGSDDNNFEQSLARSKESRLSVPVCNSFFPAEIKLIGGNVNEEQVLRWVEIVFSRASRAGVKIIVLGSGKARMIPDGYGRDQAVTQFAQLLAWMGNIAAQYDVTVALEHLNRQETNFVNTLEEADAIVRKVNHKRIGLLCDIYHMMMENEPPAAILKAERRIVHCHVAEKTNRAAPGINGEDFVPYLKALRKINYKGRISIECKWTNFEEELQPSLKYLKNQILKAS